MKKIAAFWAGAVLIIAAFDFGEVLLLKSFVVDVSLSWEENIMDFILIFLLAIGSLLAVAINIIWLYETKKFIAKKSGSS